ncbi:aspartyl-phosphate phosphatase Spo0E family protein [Thermobrachium celere]|uniref:aspartyl-phosphate phosphatase Spo0E family protein n=1 Tax=Thermobrachium celere TaxID=53422 RepID=UPI0019439A33|nr:aspartyl-phosphate phosphatase Spo0E family protein [Thermobrachium celere]GFR35520.1 hypothetical protein TCEA9_13320 [Thermobrachium celere]
MKLKRGNQVLMLKYTNQLLNLRMEILRERLNKEVLRLGTNTDRVLYMSKELDRLINLYIKLNKN